MAKPDHALRRGVTWARPQAIVQKTALDVVNVWPCSMRVCAAQVQALPRA